MPQNRIREFRKRSGMTTEQLAEAAGLSQPHLSRLENNKRMLLTPVAERIAGVLGATTAQIMGLNEDEMEARGGQGFAEDIVPYVARPGDPFSALATSNRYLFTVETDAVDKARVYRGDIVVIDDSQSRMDRLKPLEVVRVRYHPVEDFMTPITLLRQFVPPRLLITNSSTGNLPSIDMDEDDAHIVGIVVGTYRRND